MVTDSGLTIPLSAAPGYSTVYAALNNVGGPATGAETITIIANTDCHEEVETGFVVAHAAGPLTDALTGTVVEGQDGNFQTKLAPGQVMIFPMRIPVEGDEAATVEDFDPEQAGTPKDGSATD